MSDAAVDSATAKLATTSLNAPAEGGEPATIAATDAISQSAAEGRRLYIGNLAYGAKEADLKEFFKNYLVESTSIPTNPKNDRPVGYAFVDLSTPSEAERAVNELNLSTILERKVSVQLANKPEAAGEGATNGDARRRSSGRGRLRGRGRGGRAGRGGRTETDGESTPVETNGTTEAPLADTTNVGEAAKTTKAKGLPRAPTQRGPPEDGVPSKTKVMVANLPYDMKEEQLLEIFKDYSPTAAKLALRPIPRFMVRKLQARGEARKGRGFAFVSLASEELQQKAIAEMNGKEVEGRELAVKVAIDSPGKEDDAVGGETTAVDGKENGPTAGVDTTTAPVVAQ